MKRKHDGDGRGTVNILRDDSDLAKASDGGWCRLCRQPFTRYSMVMFSACELPERAMTYLRDSFGDNQGRGYVCKACFGALKCLDGVVASVKATADSSHPVLLFALSIFLLIRRDAGRDFSLELRGRALTFSLDEISLNGRAVSLPVAVCSGSRLASPELVLRHGCQCSSVLDKRSGLLLEALQSVPIPKLTEAQLLATVKAFLLSRI